MKVKVLHIPARTKFARSIKSHKISIVNGNKSIPIDASFEWALENFSNQNFDVIHIHSVEITDISIVEKLINLCEKNSVGVVYTIHDHLPQIDEKPQDFHEKLKLIFSRSTVLTTLTDGCRKFICEKYKIDQDKIKVIPHGSVLDLDSEYWDIVAPSNEKFIYSIHGGFRKNKGIMETFLNYSLCRKLSSNSRLEFLTRAISITEYRNNPEIERVLFISKNSKNIDFGISENLEDKDIAKFVYSSDAIILPYRWGTHSGQLELAMDLGIPVVTTNVGFYRDQLTLHSCKGADVVWVDWENSDLYSHGRKLLEGLEAVRGHSRPILSSRKKFHEFRIDEREKILDKYFECYATSI